MTTTDPRTDQMRWPDYKAPWPLAEPHGRACPCFACALTRQERGFRPLPTTLELIARRRGR